MGFKNETFVKLWYFEAGASGTGKSPEDRADLADNTAIMEAGADEVLTEATFLVEEAVSGTTAVDVGDGSDADGLVANANVTLGTPGAYKGDGAYVSGAHKYYATATDVALAVTGTATDGKGVVAVKGYRV